MKASFKSLSVYSVLNFYTGCCVLDSPGVPPSAGAHQLFRGFSFIATALLEEEGTEESAQPPPHPVVQVSALYVSIIC